MAQIINNETIKISSDVLVSIINLAIDEVEGAKTHEESLTDKLKKNPAIKISLEDNNLDIDAQISILYGKEIPILVKNVQENIISQIEIMTNIQVNNVNITVASLHNDKSM